MNFFLFLLFFSGVSTILHPEYCRSLELGGNETGRRLLSFSWGRLLNHVPWVSFFRCIGGSCGEDSGEGITALQSEVQRLAVSTSATSRELSNLASAVEQTNLNVAAQAAEMVRHVSHTAIQFGRIESEMQSLAEQVDYLTQGLDNRIDLAMLLVDQRANLRNLVGTPAGISYMRTLRYFELFRNFSVPNVSRTALIFDPFFGGSPTRVRAQGSGSSWTNHCAFRAFSQCRGDPSVWRHENSIRTLGAWPSQRAVCELPSLIDAGLAGRAEAYRMERTECYPERGIEITESIGDVSYYWNDEACDILRDLAPRDRLLSPTSTLNPGISRGGRRSYQARGIWRWSCPYSVAGRLCQSQTSRIPSVGSFPELGGDSSEDVFRVDSYDCHELNRTGQRKSAFEYDDSARVATFTPSSDSDPVLSSLIANIEDTAYVLDTGELEYPPLGGFRPNLFPGTMPDDPNRRRYRGMLPPSPTPGSAAEMALAFMDGFSVEIGKWWNASEARPALVPSPRIGLALEFTPTRVNPILVNTPYAFLPDPTRWVFPEEFFHWRRVADGAALVPFAVCSPNWVESEWNGDEEVPGYPGCGSSLLRWLQGSSLFSTWSPNCSGTSSSEGITVIPSPAPPSMSEVQRYVQGAVASIPSSRPSVFSDEAIRAIGESALATAESAAALGDRVRILADEQAEIARAVGDIEFEGGACTTLLWVCLDTWFALLTFAVAVFLLLWAANWFCSRRASTLLLASQLAGAQAAFCQVDVNPLQGRFVLEFNCMVPGDSSMYLGTCLLGLNVASSDSVGGEYSATAVRDFFVTSTCGCSVASTSEEIVQVCPYTLYESGQSGDLGHITMTWSRSVTGSTEVNALTGLVTAEVADFASILYRQEVWWSGYMQLLPEQIFSGQMLFYSFQVQGASEIEVNRVRLCSDSTCLGSSLSVTPIEVFCLTCGTPQPYGVINLRLRLYRQAAFVARFLRVDGTAISPGGGRRLLSGSSAYNSTLVDILPTNVSTGPTPRPTTDPDEWDEVLLDVETSSRTLLLWSAALGAVGSGIGIILIAGVIRCAGQCLLLTPCGAWSMDPEASDSSLSDGSTPPWKCNVRGIFCLVTSIWFVLATVCWGILYSGHEDAANVVVWIWAAVWFSFLGYLVLCVAGMAYRHIKSWFPGYRILIQSETFANAELELAPLGPTLPQLRKEAQKVCQAACAALDAKYECVAICLITGEGYYNPTSQTIYCRDRAELMSLLPFWVACCYCPALASLRCDGVAQAVVIFLALPTLGRKHLDETIQRCRVCNVGAAKIGTQSIHLPTEGVTFGELGAGV